MDRYGRPYFYGTWLQNKSPIGWWARFYVKGQLLATAFLCDMTVTLVWTKHYCCLLWAVHTCFIYLQSSKECGVWLQALWAASWLALLFLIKGVPYQQCSFPSAYCFADLLLEGHDTSEKNLVLAQPVGLVLLHTKVWAAALHMGPAEKGAELVMSETGAERCWTCRQLLSPTQPATAVIAAVHLS